MLLQLLLNLPLSFWCEKEFQRNVFNSFFLVLMVLYDSNFELIVHVLPDLFSAQPVLGII